MSPRVEAPATATAVVSTLEDDSRLFLKFYCPKCNIGNVLMHNSTIILNPSGTFVWCKVCNHTYSLDIRYKDAGVSVT